MYVNQKTNVTFLLLGFTVAMLASSMGCRTGGFTKPDMSKLAFWKSENSIFASKTQKMPPPPARHFDPSPINGEMESESQLANNDNTQRFRNDITEMRAEIDAAAKSLSKPIRKPYSDSKDAVSQFAANTGSSFESKSGSVKSKLDQFKGEVNSGLNTAQNDFQAAMSTTSDSLNTTDQSQDNDFVPTGSVAKSSNDMTQGWKDNLALPTGIEKVTNKIDQSLANVNNAIYDVNGKLASSKTSAVNQFQERVSSFQQEVVVPKMNAAAQTSNDFRAGVAQKVNSVAEVATNLATGKSFSHDAMPIQMPKTGFDPASNQAQPELKLVQAQMEEAKRQIEELKQQISIRDQAPTSFGSAPSGNGAIGFNTSSNSTMPMAQGERVAQLQAPNLGGQFGSSTRNSDPIQANLSALNPLRVNSPFQPDNTSTASPNQPTAPAYPSTTHGQFAPRGNDFSGNFAPMAPPIGASGSAQVGFESANNQSMVVTPNNATASSQGVSKIRNYVSEVDIPEAILTGSGSYAPGSVQPLQSNK